MKLATDRKSIRIASAEVLNYVRATKSDLSKDTLFDIKLCVEEAVRNAIVHGNKNKKELFVDLSFSLKDDTLKIIICDSGDGFALNNLPDPTDGNNLYKEGGRGVYLIHRLMDKMKYNKKGNCVTMEKKLA